MAKMTRHLFESVWRFYYEGFKNMTVGRTVWMVILIKLFIMFFILRLFLFQRVEPRFSFQESTSALPESTHPVSSVE